VKINKKIIVIAVMILLPWLWHTVRMMSVKYWMEDYLKKEYGKEFVVNRVGYIPSYYGDGLKIKGIAHPKDDPSLKFDIIRDASGGVFEEYPTYGESYIRDLWEKQKREELKIVLKSDIVWAGINAFYKEEELYGRTISVKEAEQQFNNKMELFISYGLFVNFQDYVKRLDEFENLINGKLSNEQTKSLFRIIRKLKNNNYTLISLQIRYFNDKYKADVRKKPVRYLNGKISYYERLSELEKGTVLCRFRIKDLNHINRPEDVKRFIDLEAGYLYHADLKDQN